MVCANVACIRANLLHSTCYRFVEYIKQQNGSKNPHNSVVFLRIRVVIFRLSSHYISLPSINASSGLVRAPGSEGQDQTAPMGSLIRAFAVRKQKNWLLWNV